MLWNTSGGRQGEQVQVAEATNRGTTYRGYTVIGPTRASQLPAPPCLLQVKGRRGDLHQAR